MPPRRVLVVEDHGPSRIALSRLLTLSGYWVEAFETVVDAAPRLHWAEFIFLDLHLRDGPTGVGLLRRVRHEKLKARVAVTSAAAEVNVLAEVERLGPDASFPKPYDFSELMRWMETAEDQRSQGRKAASPEAGGDGSQGR